MQAVAKRIIEVAVGHIAGKNDRVIATDAAGAKFGAGGMTVSGVEDDGGAWRSAASLPPPSSQQYCHRALHC